MTNQYNKKRRHILIYVSAFLIIYSLNHPFNDWHLSPIFEPRSDIPAIVNRKTLYQRLPKPVDSVTVYSAGDVRFRFKDGTEIQA